MSLEEADAVENVAKGTLITFVVHVKLTVARAHLDLCLLRFSELIDIVSQRSTAAQIGHVSLRDPRSLLMDKLLQSLDVAVFLEIFLSLILLGLGMPLCRVWVPSDPPLELGNLLLLDLDHLGCLLLVTGRRQSS